MTITKAAVRAAAHLGDPFPENYERVWQETWGHLAPHVRQVYVGHVLFTLGCHGDITVIDWDFELPDGMALEGSPWFHTDLHDQVWEWLQQKNLLRGGIWRFDGTFERLKNGKSRWRGKVRPMRVAYRFSDRRPKKSSTRSAGG